VRQLSGAKDENGTGLPPAALGSQRSVEYPGGVLLGPPPLSKPTADALRSEPIVWPVQVIEYRPDIVETMVNPLSLSVGGHERKCPHIHRERVLWLLLVDSLDSLPPTDVEIPTLSPGARRALWFVLRVSEEFSEEPVDDSVFPFPELSLALSCLVRPVRFPLKEYLEGDRVFGPGQLIDE
ncbi:hypothetical protein, partial [Halorubrum sp. SD626R]|uniref:hypothetical protein n=1 Tax=Halorubrum sp. SD626R TaxID=1419722 RepID=UPI0013053E46